MKHKLGQIIGTIGLGILLLGAIASTAATIFGSSPIQAAQKQTHRVVLVTMPGCPACDEAKQLLRAAGIKFSTTSKGQPGVGYVPQLFVDGKYKGYGVGPVSQFIASQR